MRRIGLAIVLAVCLALMPLGAEAQQVQKVYRIGVLSPLASSFGPGPSFEAFRQMLRELGYVEERDVMLEYRWADGRPDRLLDLAADLVRLRVDVILAWGTPAALAAKKLSSTVPIVFVGVGDAVGVGLIASLARPGGWA